MNRIEIASPTCVALPWTIARRIASKDPNGATALYLYAAHRLMRLAVWLRDRDARTVRRLVDLDAGAFEVEPERMEEFAKAFKDLQAAADLALKPVLDGRPDEAPDLVSEIEPLLEVLCGHLVPDGYLVTLEEGRADLVNVWIGPCGLGTARFQNPGGRSTAWWDAALRPLGPATAGDPAQPLCPMPGPEWWEDPDGLVYDRDGQPAAPAAKLSPAIALGRLLAWSLATDGDFVSLAASLADMGRAEAAAEVLLIGRGRPLAGWTATEVEEVRGFLMDHELSVHLRSFDTAMLAVYEAREAACRASEDYQGLREVLLARQQIEQGSAKAVTLLRLANLFETRLPDPEARLLCLLSALEATPGDEGLPAEIADLARAVNQTRQAAERILSLAEKTSGAERGRLAREAASLAQEASDLARARTAYRLAIETAPRDHDLLVRASEVAVALQDHEWLQGLLRARLDAAPDRPARVEAALALAVLSRDALGRPDEAIQYLRDALNMDPGRLDAFEALSSALLEAHRTAEARALAEDLRMRLLEVAPRVSVLRHLASLLARDFPDDPHAEVSVLSELVALEPADRDALHRLAALCEGLADFRRLLCVLRRLSQVEPEAAVAHLLAMSEVALRRLQDPFSAIGFLMEAAALDPAHPDPPARIRELHEALGMWAEVARDLEAEAARLDEPDRAAVLVRLGEVSLERLGDRTRAKKAFWEALAIAPRETRPSLARRLADLHAEDHETQRECEALSKAAEALGEDESAADLYATLGERALEPGRPDVLAARAHFEKAVHLNPLHRTAVERLAGLLLDAGEPERVIPLVDPVASMAAQQADAGAERRLRVLGGRAAERLGDAETAAQWYARALALDPSDLGTRLALARIDSKAGRNAEALQVLTPLLEGGAEGLGGTDRMEALEIAAKCAEGLKDPAQALKWMEQAVTLRGAPDAEALRALARLAEQAGDGRRAIHYLEKLVSLEPQGPERFASKMRLGDLYDEVWKEPRIALNWYREAAYEGASPKAALLKALQVAVASSLHEEARDVLERLIELEQDGLKRAQYHYALASHLQDHLMDPEGAKDHLWAALELNPDLQEAVTALETLLAARKDTEGLATLYRLLIRRDRLAGREKHVCETLRRLAGLYSDALNNPALAVETLQQVLELAPDDAEAAAALADVLTRMPGREAEALRAHRRAIALDPTCVESYRAVRELCILTKDADGAWCAASALAVLRKATDAEQAAFEAGRQPTLTLKRDSLPPDAFARLIQDEAADPGMARVFAILTPPLRRILPFKTAADLGFSEADLVDMRVKGLLQNMALAVSKVLGITLPRLYRTPGRNGLLKVPLNPPALAVGDDVAMAWRGRELRFSLARALVTFRPGFEWTGATDAATLRWFFLTGLRVAFPDFPLPEDAGEVENLAQKVREMLPAQARSELEIILTEFRRSRRDIDIAAFLEGVDRTASRAGLFMANDLMVAAIQLQEDSIFISELEFGDRLTDLCSYAVSEQYAELRRLMLKS